MSFDSEPRLQPPPQSQLQTRSPPPGAEPLSIAEATKASGPDRFFFSGRAGRLARKIVRGAPVEDIIDDLRERNLLGLIDEVCHRRNVTRFELCGRSRTRRVAIARHEVWWLLRRHPTLAFSFDEIGRLFDRNHSSVLHGVRAFQRFLRNGFIEH